MADSKRPLIEHCRARAAVFEAVLPDTQAALAEMCRLRHFRAGETITHQDERADFIGCVLSGILRMQKTLADGRQHIVGLLIEGDLFGRMFDGPSEFSVEAATDVEFCAFPRPAFEALLQRAPDLDRAVMLNILTELDRARDWMLILSNQKISSRLAGFMILMMSRFRGIDRLLVQGSEGIELRIPIGRTDLAHLLGTRPESVSRAFHGLEDAGEIEILEPDRVLVRDIEALAQRAGDDEIAGLSDLRGLLAAERGAG
jgi:CRP/FNR family transcriptional regulator